VTKPTNTIPENPLLTRKLAIRY